MYRLREPDPVNDQRRQDRPRVSRGIHTIKETGDTPQGGCAVRRQSQSSSCLFPVEGRCTAFPEVSDDLHDILQWHWVRRHRGRSDESDGIRVGQHRKQSEKVFDFRPLENASQMQDRNAPRLQPFRDIT